MFSVYFSTIVHIPLYKYKGEAGSKQCTYIFKLFFIIDTNVETEEKRCRTNILQYYVYK
jgi:hypothetical protein